MQHNRTRRATATPTTFTAEVVAALADGGADLALAIPTRGDGDVPACVVVTVGAASVRVDLYQQRTPARHYRAPDGGVQVGEARRFYSSGLIARDAEIAEACRVALSMTGAVAS